MVATVAKSSLREEFDALKAHFEGLSGDIPEEVRALFQAMLMLFEGNRSVVPVRGGSQGLPNGD